MLHLNSCQLVFSKNKKMKHKITACVSCIMNPCSLNLIPTQWNCLNHPPKIQQSCFSTFYLPHCSSSELSPQSSTLLQTWSSRKHTLSFLHWYGLVAGHGSLAGERSENSLFFHSKCITNLVQSSRNTTLIFPLIVHRKLHKKGPTCISFLHDALLTNKKNLQGHTFLDSDHKRAWFCRCS